MRQRHTDGEKSGRRGRVYEQSDDHIVCIICGVYARVTQSRNYPAAAVDRRRHWCNSLFCRIWFYTAHSCTTWFIWAGAAESRGSESIVRGRERWRPSDRSFPSRVRNSPYTAELKLLRFISLIFQVNHIKILSEQIMSRVTLFQNINLKLSWTIKTLLARGKTLQWVTHSSLTDSLDQLDLSLLDGNSAGFVLSLTGCWGLSEIEYESEIIYHKGTDQICEVNRKWMQCMMCMYALQNSTKRNRKP